MHEGKDFWDADHAYHLLLQLLVDFEKDKKKQLRYVASSVSVNFSSARSGKQGWRNFSRVL